MTEAASNELPLSNRSRRFMPPLFGVTSGVAPRSLVMGFSCLGFRFSPLVTELRSTPARSQGCVSVASFRVRHAVACDPAGLLWLWLRKRSASATNRMPKTIE